MCRYCIITQYNKIVIVLCEICGIFAKFASIQFPGVKDQVSQEPWANLNFWINSYIYNILYVQLWSVLVN